MLRHNPFTKFVNRQLLVALLVIVGLQTCGKAEASTDNNSYLQKVELCLEVQNLRKSSGFDYNFLRCTSTSLKGASYER